MPFYDESHSFVHGFECGQIWQRMEDGEKLERYLVHTSNIPQIRLMEIHFGYAFEIKVYDDTWAYLTSITNHTIPKRATL